MTPVLVIGGTQELRSCVLDALAGRGRDAVELDPGQTGSIDDAIQASGGVVYLGGSDTRWQQVRESLQVRGVVCVSTQPGARHWGRSISEVEVAHNADHEVSDEELAEVIADTLRSTEDYGPAPRSIIVGRTA